MIVSAVSIEPLRPALVRLASVKSMRVFFLPAAVSIELLMSVLARVASVKLMVEEP